MEDNRKAIIAAIDSINNALSTINAIMEKTSDEQLHNDISRAYPFNICIEEINAMFNAWKWDIKESLEMGEN